MEREGSITKGGKVYKLMMAHKSEKEAANSKKVFNREGLDVIVKPVKEGLPFRKETVYLLYVSKR